MYDACSRYAFGLSDEPNARALHVIVCEPCLRASLARK